jgi:hypothetical protein
MRRLAVGLLATSLLLGASRTQSLSAQTPALPVSFPTPAEEADYLSFTSPAEVGPYLGRLADEAAGLELDTLPGPAEIPIARISALPKNDEAPVVRVLVVGAQHGIERAGLEVALRLARDLTTGRLSGLREGLEVRIVPMANPWGVENRRRENETGVDLATDHLRLAAAETRAVWAEYTTWRPHVVLDLHELGPSEYGVQVGVPTHPGAPAARRFARFYMLPYVANRLARRDIHFHEYVATWVAGRTFERAAVPASDSLGDGDEAPRVWFSPPSLGAHSARNAFALAGSVSFFIAVPSSRDIVGLHERTDRMYLTVQALLEAAAGLSVDLVAATSAATALPKDALALRARYVARDETVRMPWVFINDRGQREQGVLAPWRPDVEVQDALSPPRGWWVAPSETELIEALRGHGFAVETPPSTTDTASWGPEAIDGATVLAYPRCRPPGAGPAAEAEAGDALHAAAAAPPAGAAWVAADQPGARLLFTMIEPWSDTGWFSATRPDAPQVDCEAEPVYPVYRVVP